MNELDLLKERVSFLEGILLSMNKSDRLVFQKHTQYLDGQNLQFATGTGTKIGTASGQKIAVYGATPVIQALAISAPSTPGSSYSQAEAQSAVNAINSLRTAIKNFGITA